jgi:hypothetical protein
MNCYIRLTKNDNVFTATVLGVPEITITASTRDAAFEQARMALFELCVRDEIVEVKVPTTKEQRAQGIGIFADVDDATWAEYEADIQAYRTQVNAQERASMEVAEAA